MLYRDTITAFLERARSGSVCLGVHCSSMSPQLVELYGFAGLDFVIVGTEVEGPDCPHADDETTARIDTIADWIRDQVH